MVFSLPHAASLFCAISLGLALVGATPGELPAQENRASDPPRIAPIDESPAHPAFHQFWRQFQRAVEERDGEFLLSVVSKNIKVDFGGGEGRAEFAARWKPSNSKSPLWDELEKIIRLGGSLGDGPGTVFTAPHAFARWPNNFDAFEYVFVSGRNVRFRAQPNAEAEVIRSVSWEIMKVDAEGDDTPSAEWTRLRAHDGRQGFVHNDYVRSPIDFRIGFSEDGDGDFTMDFFIAGD